MMRRLVFLRHFRQIFDTKLPVVSLACTHQCQVIRLLSDYEHTRHRKKPRGGSRILTDSTHVFEFNAWDNVVWDEEQEDEARRKTMEQSAELLSHDLKEKYENEADANWDAFYDQHQNRFFKDRHWLFTEFPELIGKSTAKCCSWSHDETDPSLMTYGAADRLLTDSRGCSSDDGFSAQSITDDPVLVNSRGVNHNADFAKMPTNPISEHDSLTLSGAETDVTLQACSNSVKTVDVAGDTGKGSAQLESELHDVMDRDSNTVLSSASQSDSSYPGVHSTFRVLEVGCGAGNTVFPVLQTNNDPGLMVYCCDFSSTAIQIVKEHADYDSSRCHAFICDVASPDSPVPFPEQSLDVIILIFVLSAINPEKMQSVVERLASFLRPGGMLLFRDYGRYDMAQLRFKKGRCLSENFYVRGDGTRVYFFTQDELRDMFTSAGLKEKQNIVDRRMQVNRGRQLKMYRVWIQCKYQKPLLQS